MPTDKHALEITIEKVNEAYMPSYTPLFPILTKTKKYDEFIGEVKLKETSVIGDARAREINAQDTEFKHAKSAQATKNFNKYFKGIKHIVSGFVDNSDFQKVSDEILDINLMEFDKAFFTGDANSSGAIRNNGLWLSNDPNYILKASQNLGANPTQDDWKTLFDALIREAESKLGNAAKVILLAGTAATKLGKFVPGTTTTYIRAIQNAYTDLGKQVTIEAVPTNLEDETTNGVLLLTPSQILHHYTALPYIKGNGYNDENSYTWMSLIYGSSMVDVQKSGAIIKKPLTFTA